MFSRPTAGGSPTARPLRLGADPAAIAVQDNMVRALGVLRIVVLAHAIALNIYRRDNFVNPTLGVVVVVAMAAWTVAMWLAYRSARRRTWPLLVADLVVTMAILASSPLLKGAGFSATVPGFWVMSALMAWAVMRGWRGGLVAGVLIAGTDLVIRQDIGQGNLGNVFLLLIGGPIVGYLAESLQRMAAERDAAEREAAAERERARLARAVHDGVLQVLAMVERRGTEAGGELAELGRLAGEQEVALRSLIRAQDKTPATAPGVIADLGAALQAMETMASPRVSVAAPREPVRLPAEVVDEVAAAVGQCLSNVRHHVAPEAAAWVLVEDLGDRVVVCVRDEGPGIPEGRLEAAQAEGRLGVAASIRGRIAEVGGTAELTSGGFGTEWEFTIVREES